MQSSPSLEATRDEGEAFGRKLDDVVSKTRLSVATNDPDFGLLNSRE